MRETAANHRRLCDMSGRLAAMKGTESAAIASDGAALCDRGMFFAALARLAATIAAEETAAATATTHAEWAMAQAQHRRDVTRDKALTLGSAIRRMLDEAQGPDLARNVKGRSQERSRVGACKAGRFEK